MKFRTEIAVRPFAPEERIGYANRILALGSCFASETASRLCRLRFRCTAHPTGILFNPASIADALEDYAAARPAARGELHRTDGVWHHFGFHGSFSGTDPDAVLDAMNRARHLGAEALRAADRVLLTFGTAWVYERDGRAVANCHRRPAAEFVRRRLTVTEIAERYGALLRGPLAGKRVILTVSPVRHLADGLEGNAASKAVLRLAADELAAAHDTVRYFPAYEAVLDDLRDYRFYADDMAHPAPAAAEYVWEKFAAAALDDPTRALVERVRRIVEAAEHRPLHPDSEAYRAFCRARLAEIDTLPEMDFAKERAFFARNIG